MRRVVLTETISGKLDLVMPQKATADRISGPPAPDPASDMEGLVLAGFPIEFKELMGRSLTCRISAYAIRLSN